MPIGIERINARHQQPNSRIIFIKPLPGPTAAFAQDFLERIAAVTHPIMKAHHLSITTLEEYEPNTEFVGRNFNAGEVIQLVLRARGDGGRWLGFRQVQMVMMHELAHCQEMNHSRAFWAVRNALADELRVLWGRGYTGDGFWGRGATLLSPQYETPLGLLPLPPDLAPRNLCGGTFRSSRRRKRKRKAAPTKKNDSITYAERQQKRIAKKFGTNGVVLGDDADTRIKLEDGKKVKAKPRVAGSVRGRELRAAAALARFVTKKKEEEEEEVEDNKVGESESESETEDEFEEKDGRFDSLGEGSRIKDARGRGMIRVCGGGGGGGGAEVGIEGDDGCGVEVKKERDELLLGF